MEESTVSFRQLAGSAKHFARRLLTIGENRMEILAVEVQEERERLLHALLLALGVGAFGLLAAMALTAFVVVLLWAYSPAAVLLILSVIYSTVAVCLCNRLMSLISEWQTLPASIDQLRKDRACVEKILA